MQKFEDSDVRGKGMIDPRWQPNYRDTIGTGPSDISRGQMLLPNAYDMPIVRKLAFLDTRFRDVTNYPNAGRVIFELESPIMSVSRISLVSAQIPIRLADNPGMQANDYVMMSIGMNLPDVITVTNFHDAMVAPPIPPPQPSFSRSMAYVPLIGLGGATFAYVTPDNNPPYSWYTDFMKPIASIERLEISWHRFAKSATATTTTDYIITPLVIPPGESVYDVDKNAMMCIAFFCKNRRPE